MSKIEVTYKWSESNPDKINSITYTHSQVPRVGEEVSLSFVDPKDKSQNDKFGRVEKVYWRIKNGVQEAIVFLD